MKWILKGLPHACLQCIFLFVFLLACTSHPLHCNNQHDTGNSLDIRKFLTGISFEERLVLDYFFRALIQQDSIGYVLLEGKPMSFYSYIKPKLMLPAFQSEPAYELDLFFEGFNPHGTLFEKGLEVWKKYEHYFCGENIFFDVFEQDAELHFVKFVVINKRLVLSQFDHYFDKFKRLDPSLLDKESLFEALLHNQKFKERFYDSDDLMGICLGYGERNAALFKKRASILSALGRLGFTLKKLTPERRKSLKKDCDLLEKSLSSFRDHDSRKFLFNLGLGFCADFTDPETHVLQKKYRHLHKTLPRLYVGKDFLEETLHLISLTNCSE